MENTWHPEFSKQGPKETNCGQHCVAMITKLPVGIISAQLGTNRGTTDSQISGVLIWFGYDASRYKKAKFWEQLPDLCVVHVARHWCLYFKGTVYCSCEGIMPYEKFRHRVKGFIEVKISKD